MFWGEKSGSRWWDYVFTTMGIVFGAEIEKKFSIFEGTGGFGVLKRFGVAGLCMYSLKKNMFFFVFDYFRVRFGPFGPILAPK